VDLPVPNMTAALPGGVAGVRIGLPHEYFFTVPELDGQVQAAVLAAVDQMVATGASVRDVCIPHAAEALIAQRVTMLAEAYAHHEPDLQQRPELYGSHTRRAIRQGALYSGADCVQAQRVRALVKMECSAAFANVDVLVALAMLSTAPAFQGWEPDRVLTSPSFMAIWNLTGLPALSLPC
jgi:aspartyl-tRNA(Asn)/glutamyl-tRNA(Gln) amidotransferase subunit A